MYLKSSEWFLPNFVFTAFLFEAENQNFFYTFKKHKVSLIREYKIISFNKFCRDPCWKYEFH
jgi:hypothetical protein